MRSATRSRQCAGLGGLWASGVCEVSLGEASAPPARWGWLGSWWPRPLHQQHSHMYRDVSVSLEGWMQVVWLRKGVAWLVRREALPVWWTLPKEGWVRGAES